MLLFTLVVSLVLGPRCSGSPRRGGAAAPNAACGAHRRAAAARPRRAASSRAATRLRRLLVGGELALSVVVLVAAGLLVRSFARVQQVPPGFNPRDVLTFELTDERAAATRSRRRCSRPIAQLWQRLASLPGVTAAGGVSALPLSQMMAWGPITVEGRTPAPGEAFINADIRVVGGDYFRGDGDPARGRAAASTSTTRATSRA